MLDEGQEPTNEFAFRSLYRYSDANGEYGKIRFNSQTDYDHLRSHPAGHFYAVTLEHNGDYNTLSELRRGVKVLSKLERKLDKMIEKYGEPQTIGQQVLRLGLALGATHLFLPSFAEQRYVTLAEGALYIDRLVTTWKDLAKKIA